MVLYVAGSLFTIWMAIETVRRWQTEAAQALEKLIELDGSHKSAEATQSLQRIMDEAEYLPAYKKSEIRGWVRQARKKIRQLE